MADFLWEDSEVRRSVRPLSPICGVQLDGQRPTAIEFSRADIDMLLEVKPEIALQWLYFVRKAMAMENVDG